MTADMCEGLVYNYVWLAKGDNVKGAKLHLHLVFFGQSRIFR